MPSLENPAPSAYLRAMRRQPKFQPAIPVRATTVPDGPDWLHEIKHDGYRLIIQREGLRVRLFTRRGFDWSDRFPLIRDAARKLKSPSFVIDGEAVWLDDNGLSHFDRLPFPQAPWRGPASRLRSAGNSGATISARSRCTPAKPGYRSYWPSL